MVRLVFILIWSYAVLTSPFSLAQSKTSSAPRRPSWALQPPNTATGVEVSPAIREARSHAFDDRFGIRHRLDEDRPVRFDSGSFADRPATEPLPVAGSDDVVVGAVSSYQSFLSSDHTAIYTELYVTVERVLKSRSYDVSPGSVLTILKSGGALQHNGKLLKFAPTGSMTEELDIKERYVLFLKSEPKLSAYRDLEAWRLENNHAVPMDLGQRASSRTEPKLIRYSQLTELEFLTEIETLIQPNIQYPSGSI